MMQEGVHRHRGHGGQLGGGPERHHLSHAQAAHTLSWGQNKDIDKIADRNLEKGGVYPNLRSVGCRSGLCSSSVPATSPLWTRLGIEANQGSVFSIVTTSNQSQLSIHLQGGGGGGAVLGGGGVGPVPRQPRHAALPRPRHLPLVARRHPRTQPRQPRQDSPVSDTRYYVDDI